MVIPVVFLCMAGVVSFTPQRPEQLHARTIDGVITEKFSGPDRSSRWAASEALAAYCREWQNQPVGLVVERFRELVVRRPSAAGVQSGLIDTLRLVHPYPEEVVPELILIFEREFERPAARHPGGDLVLRSVIDALACSEDPRRRAIFAKLALLMDQTRDPSRRNWDLCRSSIDAMRQIDRELLVGMIPQFCALLGEGSMVRQSVADALAEIPEKVPAHGRWQDILAGLTRALRDGEDPLVRMSAARTLGLIGPPARSSGGALLPLLDERRSSGLRRSAVVALGRIGPSEKAILAALVRIAEQDRDRDVRDDALDALEEIGPLTPEVVEALRAALTSRENRVRLASLRVLCRFAHDHPSAPILLEALGWVMKGGADIEIAREAAETMVRIGEPSIEPLMQAIGAPGNPGHRRSAIEALERVALLVPTADAEALLWRLIPLFDDPAQDAEVTRAAARAVSGLTEHLTAIGLPHDRLRDLARALSQTNDKLKAVRGQEYAAFMLHSARIKIELITGVIPAPAGIATRPDAPPAPAAPAEAPPPTPDPFWKQLLVHQLNQVSLLGLVALLILLWVASAGYYHRMHARSPGTIVDLNEQLIHSMDSAGQGWSPVKTILWFLRCHLSPVRWWCCSQRSREGWVDGAARPSRAWLGSRAGKPAAFEVAVNGDPERLDWEDLEPRLAEAFPREKSGLLILGDDPSSRAYLTFRIARWASGERRAGADPGSPTRLPIVIEEKHLAGSRDGAEGNERFFALLRKRLWRVLDGHAKAPISRHLFDKLHKGQNLFVIYLADRVDPDFLNFLEDEINDWAVSTSDRGALGSVPKRFLIEVLEPKGAIATPPASGPGPDAPPASRGAAAVGGPDRFHPLEWSEVVRPSRALNDPRFDEGATLDILKSIAHASLRERFRPADISRSEIDHAYLWGDRVAEEWIDYLTNRLPILVRRDDPERFAFRSQSLAVHLASCSYANEIEPEGGLADFEREAAEHLRKTKSAPEEQRAILEFVRSVQLRTKRTRSVSGLA